MIKPIVISDPFPRKLDLIFTKKKLKELKKKYKLIVVPKSNKNKFYERKKRSLKSNYPLRSCRMMRAKWEKKEREKGEKRKMLKKEEGR